MANNSPFTLTITIAIILFTTLSPPTSLSMITFSPADNYLLDCGASQPTHLSDGRTFKSDHDTLSLLSTSSNTTLSSSSSSVPLFNTLRLFASESTYTFHISRPGTHFLRLYFSPIPNPLRPLNEAVFTVAADDFTLLKDFSVGDSVLKEFVVNASQRLSLLFKPQRGSVAFVNAIELVSAPEDLFDSLSGEVTHRVNVGGPGLTPANDTLYRSWDSDEGYNVFPEGSRAVSVAPARVLLPDQNPFVAPREVYSSAQHMRDSETLEPNFNLTWNFTVENGFSYLVRLHFCDIVSLVSNTLFFKVYINGIAVVETMELPSLSAAYHRDFTVKPAEIINATITVQVGCSGDRSRLITDAILNGVEIIRKLSNNHYKLSDANSGHATAAMIGLGLTATVTFVLGSIFVHRRRRNSGYSRRRSINYSLFGSRRSKSGYSTYFASSVNFGRAFSLSELRSATNNFAETAVIGAGGFGKVYLGVLGDGTKTAVKRGNPSSEQGMAEFRTEMETLSRLRHRHLVSLVGFCSEQSEMILVYEYMSNGPLRDRLHALTWHQRLEACIGAARGLHYLHTGASSAIIHRDVKSSNILLDDNLLAKVSDFGLSKAAAGLDRRHVSTAVKGGLDPECFWGQELTEKSDVYSFGVVLLEVLCGRSVIDRVEVNLKSCKKGLIDERIKGTIGEESLKKYVEAMDKCWSEEASMGDVLWNLEYSLQLQEASLVIVENKECESESEECGLVGNGSDESNVTFDGNGLFSHMARFHGR